jgi:hypothetical protein
MAIDDKAAEVSEGDPETLVPELESLLKFAEALQDKIDHNQAILFVGRSVVIAVFTGFSY